MIFWYTIGYALFIAILLAFLFSGIFRNKGPWNNFWIFALIIFLGVWTTSLWFNPVGPLWNGVAWVDLLFVGLFLALLLGASGEAGRRYQNYSPEKEIDIAAEHRHDTAAMSLFGIFFWVFMVMVLALAVIGLVYLIW